MSTVIGLCHSKGGVGKTTSSFAIATGLSLKGEKVLMVDADPQANLSISVGFNPLIFDSTIVDVFADANKIAEAIYDTDIEGLSILPSHPMLASTELQLINARSREHKLSKALKLVGDVFDYIIIDCPPQMSMLTINCLTSMDYLIAPCETSALSLYALSQLMDTIAGVQEDLNEKLEVLGILGTLYNCQAKADKEVLEEMKKNYNVLGVCKRLTAVKKGFAVGLPVVISEPKSQVSEVYMNVVDKIIKKVEGK